MMRARSPQARTGVLDYCGCVPCHLLLVAVAAVHRREVHALCTYAVSDSSELDSSPSLGCAGAMSSSLTPGGMYAAAGR